MNTDIFQRLKTGALVGLDDPEWPKVQAIVDRCLNLITTLNATAKTIDEVRDLLSVIIGKPIDNTTGIFAPFFTNYGASIVIGKNVFINHACTFLDMGGITLEDNVLIGPKVNLITENHPIEHLNRRALICSPILIKRNAWIGAAATILPGVTIGQDAVVAAGAVVTKDVPDKMVVAGVPAKIIKILK